MNFIKYSFNENKILFFIFFITFIFVIFYKKEYNKENYENCTTEDCKKKSNELKNEIEKSNYKLSFNNIQTSINELKNDIIENKQNLESQLNTTKVNLEGKFLALKKEVDLNTFYINKVKTAVEDEIKKENKKK